MMNKLTKIVATIGPACESEEMIEKLITAGVNVFRFNFKHNTVEWHGDMIERVNKVAKRMGVRIGTLIDLQGPEIRINIAAGELDLKIGEEILLDEETLKNDAKGFTISHPEIIEHLEQDQGCVVDDGAFEFEVVKKNGKTYLKCLSKGILKQRKSMVIPGADFPFPVLIDRDFDGLKLAKLKEIDFVALSFVRSAEDVKMLRKEMKKYGVEAKVVSKIETQLALDELDDIVDASDGVMVARGDLGVELPIEQVPYQQKMMIKKSIEKGKFVITATQMLESMIKSPIPTRAEVSDIANAGYDLTDATMLSGESAFGEYPLKAVEVMAKTLRFNETKFFSDSRLQFDYERDGTDSMVCDAAYDLFLEMRARGEEVAGFIVFSHTGQTVKILSSLRPDKPIVAFCKDSKVAESLTVSYGVLPIVMGKKYKKNEQVTQDHVLAGIRYLEDMGVAKKGERFIVMHGDVWDVAGGTSTVKLVQAR